MGQTSCILLRLECQCVAYAQWNKYVLFLTFFDERIQFSLLARVLQRTARLCSAATMPLSVRKIVSIWSVYSNVL